MLFGILQPDAGNVWYWRDDYKKYIGIQLQSTPFFEGYTAEQNLKLFAALYCIRLTQKQMDLKLKECGIFDVKNTLAVRMSIGQQKRLAIALATLHEPELVILDEPTAGLDPRAQCEIRKMIKNLTENNVSILFSTHDMQEVSNLADRVVLINDGKIIAQGHPDILVRKHGQKDLETLYLKLTESMKG